MPENRIKAGVLLLGTRNGGAGRIFQIQEMKLSRPTALASVKCARRRS